MFRISKLNEKSQTSLAIDGQLCGDDITTVEICCEQEIAKGKPVELLLRDLTNIDPDGQDLLRRLVDKGVRLTASGVYTAYIVQRINNLRAGESRRRSARPQSGSDGAQRS